MCLSVIVFILTLDMAKVPLGIGPGDYPRVIAVGLFILGGIQVIQGWRKGSPPLKDLYPPETLKRVFGLVLMTFIYVQLLGRIGFLYLTPFFMFGAMYYFGMRRTVTSSIISVTMTVAIYAVYKIVYHVPLPRFTLFW